MPGCRDAQMELDPLRDSRTDEDRAQRSGAMCSERLAEKTSGVHGGVDDWLQSVWSGPILISRPDDDNVNSKLLKLVTFAARMHPISNRILREVNGGHL